jgi:hypothetical protein
MRSFLSYIQSESDSPFLSSWFVIEAREHLPVILMSIVSRMSSGSPYFTFPLSGILLRCASWP